jgi:hypothetical protein
VPCILAFKSHTVHESHTVHKSYSTSTAPRTFE